MQARLLLLLQRLVVHVSAHTRSSATTWFTQAAQHQHTEAWLGIVTFGLHARAYTCCAHLHERDVRLLMRENAALQQRQEERSGLHTERALVEERRMPAERQAKGLLALFRRCSGRQTPQREPAHDDDGCDQCEAGRASFA